VVVSPDGLCWPAEGDAAHAEYVARCGADGSECPATTDWRARLRLLALPAGSYAHQLIDIVPADPLKIGLAAAVSCCTSCRLCRRPQDRQ